MGALRFNGFPGICFYDKCSDNALLSQIKTPADLLTPLPIVYLGDSSRSGNWTT